MRPEFLILLVVGGIAAFMFLGKPAEAAAPAATATAADDERAADTDGAYGLSYTAEDGWGFTFSA